LLETLALNTAEKTGTETDKALHDGFTLLYFTLHTPLQQSSSM